MTSSSPYTTRLQAGLGLLPETLKLLSIWQPGMTGQDLLRAVLASGEFPTMTARRLRNVVLEAFSPRYLVDGAAPARLLKTVSERVSKEDVRSLCFLFTCRANPILSDFVREIYWPSYSAGRPAVSKEDSLTFVRAAVSNGRTTTRWSEATITRVAGYLLGACTDFGLLGPMRRGARPIITHRITLNVASVLAHDLHFRGVSDNALPWNADWELWGLDATDALGELKRLSLHGELILQSAGGISQISWKHKTLEELAHALAHS